MYALDKFTRLLGYLRLWQSVLYGVVWWSPFKGEGFVRKVSQVEVEDKSEGQSKAGEHLGPIWSRPKMGINLGDELPNFEADTTVGKIKFHDWLGGS